MENVVWTWKGTGESGGESKGAAIEGESEVNGKGAADGESEVDDNRAADGESEVDDKGAPLSSTSLSPNCHPYKSTETITFLYLYFSVWYFLGLNM